MKQSKKFSERVFEFLEKVPEGKVCTYKDIGEDLGIKGYRAIGQVLKRNTKPIELPCHRVVCSDGRIGGYSGKMDGREKARILRKEGVVVRRGRIDLEKFGFRL